MRWCQINMLHTLPQKMAWEQLFCCSNIRGNAEFCMQYGKSNNRTHWLQLDKWKKTWAFPCRRDGCWCPQAAMTFRGSRYWKQPGTQLLGAAGAQIPFWMPGLTFQVGYGQKGAVWSSLSDLFKITPSLKLNQQEICVLFWFLSRNSWGARKRGIKRSCIIRLTFGQLLGYLLAGLGRSASCFLSTSTGLSSPSSYF